MVTTPGDARQHHILYFKRLQKVILKSTLSTEWHTKDSPVIAQIYIYFTYIYVLYADTMIHQVICCESAPKRQLYLNTTNKSTVYLCIGLNAARLQSVCVCVLMLGNNCLTTANQGL